MRAEAEPIVERSEEGYWRVRTIRVTIMPDLAQPPAADQVMRCREIFEKYCIVTSSVRGGIPVEVEIRADAAEAAQKEVGSPAPLRAGSEGG
jgi:hypothetical protein